jgi:hypothetical protein
VKQHRPSFAVIALWSSGILVLASCSSPEAEKPPVATARTVAHSTVTTRPGVAGGQIEDTVVIQAVVSAVDLSAHRVTLRGQDGQLRTYDVSQQIQDISRLQPGDQVTATFNRRVSIEVRGEGAAPSEVFEKTWGASAPGEMPGRLSASESKKVARVVSIDRVGRTAELEFIDGIVRVPVRSDVDLSQYKAGDNVIVRVTNTLSVLSR